MSDRSAGLAAEIVEPAMRRLTRCRATGFPCSTGKKAKTADSGPSQAKYNLEGLDSILV